MLAFLQEIKNLILHKPENYFAAKQISQKIDVLLGLKEDSVPDKELAHNYQTWSHISVQQFQTPYSEIFEILSFLKPQPQETFVDLGAGFGRFNLVAGLFFPEIKIESYELVPARVHEGRRILAECGFASSKLQCADIATASFALPDAEYYYIFDFGSAAEVQRVLEKLKSKAKARQVILVGRGRGIRNWIALDHPWLSQIVEPHHTVHWSVYKSAEDA